MVSNIFLDLYEARNLKSFLFNYMIRFETKNPQVKFADAFWGRFFDGLLFTEVKVPDEELLVFLKKVSLFERKTFKYLLKDNSVMFSVLFDDVVLCLKNCLIIRRLFKFDRIINPNDLFDDLKIFYPSVSRSYFENALRALNLLEDVSITDEGLVLTLNDNFEHHADVMKVSKLCFTHAAMSTDNAEMLSVSFVKDLIGRNGFSYFEVEATVTSLIESGFVVVSGDVFYIVDEDSSSRMTMSGGFRVLRDDLHVFNELSLYNDFLKYLRNTSEDNQRAFADVHNIFDEDTVKFIIKGLFNKSIVVIQGSQGYFLDTDMKRWCVDKARGGGA